MTDGVTPKKEEIQNNNQEAEATPEVNYEQRHKEAQDELSKRSEALIEANVKLAEANPKAILELEKKMQNKVIKRLYGYENIEELKLIHGDNFYEAAEDDEGEDKLTALQKEVKILKYQRQKDELNNELDKFAIENSSLLGEYPDAIDKLKSELEYISDSIPIKERIRKAKAIAFGNITSKVDEGYLALQGVSKGTSGTQKVEEKEPQNTEIDEIFASVLKNDKKKQEYIKKFL